jgi:hypothetical protein
MTEEAEVMDDSAVEGQQQFNRFTNRLTISQIWPRTSGGAWYKDRLTVGRKVTLTLTCS